MTNSAASPSSLSASTDFEYVRALVRRCAGIVIESGKEYLVEARLLPLARREGLDSIARLVAKLRAEPAGPLHSSVVEAMTINETLFFRDVHPFEALRAGVLPALRTGRATSRHLRIWSGACSTGQEPYSIAMLLREHAGQLAGWRIDLLATDLSHEVLGRARRGTYGQVEVNRGLPAPFLVKYFDRSGAHWQIKEEISGMVDFRELNLAATWPALAPFDVVFLRNVLIYFDVDTKKSILGRVRRILRPDGYLFLGAAETTMNLDDGFERVQIGNSGCYRLKPAP